MKILNTHFLEHVSAGAGTDIIDGVPLACRVTYEIDYVFFLLSKISNTPHQHNIGTCTENDLSVLAKEIEVNQTKHYHYSL